MKDPDGGEFERDEHGELTGVLKAVSYTHLDVYKRQDGFTVRQDRSAVNWIVNIDTSLRQHSGAVTRQILASPVAFGRVLADLQLGGHPDWSQWLEKPVAARRARYEIPASAGDNACLLYTSRCV